MCVADASVIAAIASPRRQQILQLIWKRELKAGEIHQEMPEISFGAVSLQLKALMEAGVVEARVESRNRFYRANRKALGPLGKMLEQMWDDALWKLKLAAELEASRRGPRPGSPKSPKKGAKRRAVAVQNKAARRRK